MANNNDAANKSDELPRHNKILIVDDDADIVQVVKIILELRGFKVCTYGSGLGVEKIVGIENPDLILLDIGLPGKMGTQVCKDIKKGSSIPILFFSAHANKEKVMTECRADGFIHKPFEVEELITLIRSKLN